MSTEMSLLQESLELVHALKDIQLLLLLLQQLVK